MIRNRFIGISAFSWANCKNRAKLSHAYALPDAQTVDVNTWIQSFQLIDRFSVALRDFPEGVTRANGIVFFRRRIRCGCLS